jgi:hypothetical protein
MNKSFVLSFVAYVVVAEIAFGDLFKLFYYLYSIPDHLGLPFWKLLVVGGVAVSWFAFMIADRFAMQNYQWPLFIALSMTLPIVSVGVYADLARSHAMARFGADAQFEHSFFRSLHEVPADFLQYLHAGALKDCEPYAWSYRDMSFYRLPNNVAVNVLPREWLERCSIKKD